MYLQKHTQAYHKCEGGSGMAGQATCYFSCYDYPLDIKGLVERKAPEKAICEEHVVCSTLPLCQDWGSLCDPFSTKLNSMPSLHLLYNSPKVMVALP